MIRVIVLGFGCGIFLDFRWVLCVWKMFRVVKGVGGRKLGGAFRFFWLGFFSWSCFLIYIFALFGVVG